LASAIEEIKKHQKSREDQKPSMEKAKQLHSPHMVENKGARKSNLKRKKIRSKRKKKRSAKKEYTK